MFSSALKSFNSNISNQYHLSSEPSFISGPWRVHEGKRKNTGTSASVFIFDRKLLEPRTGAFGSRSNSSTLKRLHEEVVERLKREASNLARLRHPSVLQILEPVEETRNGGLMFATEPVTASLAGLLQEKDDQERGVGAGGRTSRFIIQEADGTRRRRDIEMDELEIQKGLLQVGKGLEFLHDSAGLVHGNLNPEAILINSKSDWKISGLSFAGPADTTSQSSLPQISLSEVLYHDPRLPSSVQLNMDYTSPDFVMDSNISTSADLFSLGLVIIALYNSPHTSPFHTNNNSTTYKKLLSSPSSIPSPSNSFLASRHLPKDLQEHILPRLITRRPAQRMNAKEFQESQYFDNVLVSTIRFLESFPAKTPNEKSQFMRGLSRVLSEFPASVLERKVLVALLDETKDRELLPLIMQNVFKIIGKLPSSRRVVPEKVLPRLKETFVPSGTSKAAAQERDTSRDAGLMVILENMKMLADNCSAKEFKEDVLPLVRLGLDSPTHALVDASMKCLSIMLPILDFSTVKDEVFPPIASVFSKTGSLLIKVRGLEAFVLLCGGTAESSTTDDDLSGIIDEPRAKPSTSTSILDRYSVQEKLVPLLKAVRTKEPAVMMAALKVFRQVGQVADIEFLATEVLPILWSFSLGPLLNVQQFSAFMDLIKSLSSKVEQEHKKKLQELASTNGTGNMGKTGSNAWGASPKLDDGANDVNGTSDFERLVLGRSQVETPKEEIFGVWNSTTSGNSKSTGANTSNAPKFSWSSSDNQSSSTQNNSSNLGGASGRPTNHVRSITPDMNMNMSAFPALEPAPQQQGTSGSSLSSSHVPNSSSRSSVTLGANQYAQGQNSSTLSSPNMGFTNTTPQSQTNTSFSSFSIPPPPTSNVPQRNSLASTTSSFSQPLSQTRPAGVGRSTGSQQQQQQPQQQQHQQQQQQQQKQGLDKYESLL